MKKKLLLHICCAPDAVYPIPVLLKKYDVVGFFYNPNIYPETEYIKRLKEVEKLKSIYNIPIINYKYEPEKWFKYVKGYEYEPEGGARCVLCIKMRLIQTAQYAKELGFDYFATTLTISPHKNQTLIHTLGKDIAKNFSINFLSYNFRKENGYMKAVELTRDYKIYRQDYCGCIYSLRDRELYKKEKEIKYKAHIKRIEQCKLCNNAQKADYAKYSKIMCIFDDVKTKDKYKKILSENLNSDFIKNEIYFTSLKRCITKYKTIPETCKTFLLNELSIVKPTIIILKGKQLLSLIKPTPKISGWQNIKINRRKYRTFIIDEKDKDWITNLKEQLSSIFYLYSSI